MLSCIEYDFETYRNVFREISSCMNDYLYVYDISKDLYFITESAAERFAINENIFTNVIEKHREFVFPYDYEALKADLLKMCSGEKDSHDMTYRWIGKDGHPVWINCKGRTIKSSDGSPYLMIGCINEIGRRQRADNVSGLLGELSFFKDMSASPDIKGGFALRIGIDKLKNINGKFGSAKGDEVIHTVASCITRCLTRDQSVYKTAAGEYLITDFSKNASVPAAIDLYKRVRTEIDKRHEEQGYEILYTISGGVVDIGTITTRSADEIQKLSQFALGQAKSNGRNQCYCFDYADYEYFLETRELTVRMRQAAAENFEGFFLAFQPIVNVSEGKLLGAESLLRFRGKDGTVVSPVRTIPILEESGLIIPVGKWIIRTALETCREIRKYQSDFKITINLSYIQIEKSAVVNDIIRAIDETGLEASAVIVELTESGELEDNNSVKSVWNKLKERGIELAVDDFGTGYSNLKTVSYLKPEYVKIDREFTMRAMRNNIDLMLLESVIDIAHNLNGKFVVEGIETKEELLKIMKYHPEYIQGYYFGRPLPKDMFIESYIKKKPWSN